MKIEDAKILQLAEFFITKFNYIFVNIKHSNDELWIVNLKNKIYPVIRITYNKIDQVIYEQDRIKAIYEAILKTVKGDGKLLDIHVNHDEITDNELFDSIAIDTNYYSGIDISGIFPGIKYVVHEVDNEVNEINRITKDIRESQLAKIKQQKVVKKQETKPYVTYAILAICVLIFILGNVIYFLNNGTYSDVSIAIALGAYYKAFVVGANEYWRFITTGFVHIDILHLLMNMIALVSIGRFFEKQYGPLKYLVILLSSILGGSMFVHVASQNTVTLGLSGGLYGLLGAMIVYSFSTKMINNAYVRNQFISIIVINLFISFLPGVSMLGHFGGFVTGILLGIIFDENKTWKVLKQNSIVALAIAFVVLSFMCFNERKIDPVYFKTDTEVFGLYQDAGFTTYSINLSRSMINYYSK